ncbi:two-component system, NarL family, sensor histidine kinase DesK [Thalassobacillus cyri]|uniref:histidine kinase n=1 Tax=Thalassobacillus cyri TaxID=571932 RepID=A0A1H3XPR4_9BACI|nr:sensor histidine kinase [Thalassobacillus cyri]SEA00584.1 two-component system, NarL family, sensor histidine kinase DesK [Thalassobacillus cyri]
MQNWYHIIPKNTGLSIYVWIIFCGLPFFFIFRSSSALDIVSGIFMVLLFFLAYRLSFIADNWMVYVWVSIEMAINIVMTILFGYIYFSLFLAFFIGNIRSKAGFLTLYIVHLSTTVATTTFVFIFKNESLFPHLPFIIISVLGVILLPFTIYYRNKRIDLEGKLEDANKRISQLRVIEERERIARDLHDTLGQKLSLIGLKSDLAGKLIDMKPEVAKNEIHDIHQTARTALKEVREMVSNMKGANLQEETIRVRQLLEAAQIEFELEGDAELHHTPPLVENVLSMSLKEAVTNVVKHSKATICRIIIQQSPKETKITVEDNGTGVSKERDVTQGHGLQGMKERLEFVNGSLEVYSSKENGTTLHIEVPNVIQQTKQEESG